MKKITGELANMGRGASGAEGSGVGDRVSKPGAVLPNPGFRV